jgi:tRNA U55 pseudouridine synthase TruB
MHCNSACRAPREPTRALAEDIAGALRTAAHLDTFSRTRFGPFDLSRAVDLATWQAAAARLVTIGEALAHLPAIEISERHVR